MHITHISDCYLPRTGGIESQVRGLAHAQKARGHAVRVITATPATSPRGLTPISPVGTSEDDDGVEVIRLAVNMPWGLPVSPHIGTKSLGHLLGPATDVVHVHAGLVSPFAWPALRAAVYSRTPAVVTVHSIWDRWARGLRGLNCVTGWRTWPVVWTAVSDYAAHDVRAALGPRATVYIMPNGIDLDRWQPASVDEYPSLSQRGGTVGTADRPLTLVCVSRLAMRKRVDALVRILHDARGRIPPSTFLRAVIVGDGPDRTKLQRTLRQLNLAWVELAGWQDHESIRELFHTADAFVTPSRLESFGIAALEARTAGLPVLALADSGVTEFIRDGSDGLIADTDQQLAGAIVRLATEPGLLHKLSSHNRSVAPPYGWDSIVPQALDLYQRAQVVAGR